MKKVFITEDEVNSLNLSRKEKIVILNNPKIGISIGNSELMYPRSQNVNMPKVKAFADKSCFLNSPVKKGDSISSINGYVLDCRGGEIDFFQEDNPGFYATEEFYASIKNSPTVNVSFYRKVGENTRVMMMFQGRQPLQHEKIDIQMKVYPVYEVQDPFLSEKIISLRVKGLPDKIKSEVFCQDSAIDQINKSLKIYFTGLKDLDKPIGSYLLVGPTGTGKTEVAKLYSKNLGFNFVRIDMSEFAEKHNVARLLGSPPGYIGFGDKTILEKEIGIEGKKTVLLLDEVEKAHPDVHKVFLQAMDNGSITLGNDVKIDLTNTLILMTSNLGISSKSSLGIAREDKRLVLDMEKIKDFFPPEFIGRLTGVVEFKALGDESAIKILGKFVEEFNKKLREQKDCEIMLTKEAESFLVKKGFSSIYGARPLKNILQGEVYEKIADLFLSLEKQPRQRKISVDYINDEIEVSFIKTSIFSKVNV